jgi:hypothetical protein
MAPWYAIHPGEYVFLCLLMSGPASRVIKGNNAMAIYHHPSIAVCGIRVVRGTEPNLEKLGIGNGRGIAKSIGIYGLPIVPGGSLFAILT